MWGHGVEPGNRDVPLIIGRLTRHPSGIDGARSYRSGRWPCRRRREQRTPAFGTDR